MAEPGKQYLRARIQIGNAKGAHSFAPHQTVFHHDDITEDKRKRVQEVKAFSRPNLAGVNHREWNKSSLVPRKLAERRTAENFDHDRSHAYQYNYRAELLRPPNPKPIPSTSKFKVTLRDPGPGVGPQTANLKRTQEQPVHPKLESDFSTEWNLSSTINKSTLDKSFRDLNDRSKDNSVRKTKKLVRDDSYVSPIQRSRLIQEEVRRQKSLGTFNAEKKIFDKPEAPVDRKSLVNRASIEPSLKFTTTQHTGVWEYNAIEGRHMWSDTGSFEYASRGDAVRVHNPDAYNYAKPNLTLTRGG